MISPMPNTLKTMSVIFLNLRQKYASLYPKFRLRKAVESGSQKCSEIFDDGKVIVERQFRYPVDRVITEIPAGKLDSKDEDPLEAAKRELAEETGMTADTWIHMGIFYPAPAYSNETIHMFLAKDLHRGQQHLDADEFLEVTTVPIEELVDQILAGEIPDLKTQAAVTRAYLMEQRKK